MIRGEPVRTPRAHTIVRERRLGELLEAMVGPRLPTRPACAGRAPDFDAELPRETTTQRDARHARAIALCQRCDALPACAALLGDLPPGTSGVWAAQVLHERRRR
ncbi:hypothetical protein [Pseudonocardia adelaidensis]|uniref:4Fe-4S Wbl-type domain-containing protein n=1 Tax=Pseudonocardia adelaidensis TaxID=648754 RepID=A0ABP9NR86_9PSEU